jgi:hypothetical protein
MYTDSHCHITCDELYSDLEGVLSRMKDVSRVMIVCTSEEEYLRAVPIRSSDPVRFRIAFGFYPGDADEVTEERLAFLEEALKSGNVDVLKSGWITTGPSLTDRHRKISLYARSAWPMTMIFPLRFICGTPARIPWIFSDRKPGPPLCSTVFPAPRKPCGRP